MGGLGNQMFQYALGRNIALIKNTTLKLDITWFNHFNETTTPRYYNLPKFNIVENLASDKEIKKKIKYRIKMGRRHFLHNHLIANKLIYIKEKRFNFDKNILNTSDDVYLTGYWQSEKYFSSQDKQLFNKKKIKDIIRKEFTLKNKLSNHYKKHIQKIKAVGKNSVSIHIRRGDYTLDTIKNNVGLCPINYYNKALKKISQSIQNPVFFIFTDDVNWAKNNLKLKYPMNFVSYDKINNGHKNKDYEELILMSKCKHNIIANSSFSWWGAWLNNNSNKIVIAPKRWFRNKSLNTKDLIPNTWIKI